MQTGPLKVLTFQQYSLFFLENEMDFSNDPIYCDIVSSSATVVVKLLI